MQKKKEKTPGGGKHCKRVIADFNKKQISIVVIFDKVLTSLYLPG
jgi:hypothetical protein